MDCLSPHQKDAVIMCADARLRRLRIAPDMGPDRISPVIQRSEAMNETQTEVHGGSCCRGHEPKKAGPIIDPVCGMAVDPAITVHHAAHGGETYHFCSAGCRTKFLADPQRYIGSSVSSVRVAEGTIRSEEHTSELQSLMRISYAVFCLK